MESKCIFKSDELKDLCPMVKCPPTQEAQNQCITKGYCNLVEAFVDLSKRFRVIKENYEKMPIETESSKDK